MADERLEAQNSSEERRTRQESPPLTAEEFRASPVFRSFKKWMRRIMKVSKSDLDERIRLARERSPHSDNPNAPERKLKGRNPRNA
jgi:hypothetical protein